MVLDTLTYPTTVRQDVVDVLHGVSVPDPYRWLEDPDSPATTQWVQTQNELTRQVLDSRADLAPPFRTHIQALLDYDRFSAPFKRGNYIYYFVQRALANQPVLMRANSLDAPDDEAIVFIDPNSVANDGTAALTGEKFSPRGSWCAYLLSRSGSDWAEIHIRNTETLEDSPQVLEWAKFSSIAWRADESGFYYTRYPIPQSLADESGKAKRGSETDSTKNQAIYYHQLGSSEPRFVYDDPSNPERSYRLESTPDGAYLVVYVAEDCSPKNQLWIVDTRTNFGAEGNNFTILASDKLDSEFLYIANDGDLFYLRTNWKAENNRVVAARLGTPPDEWKEIVPEEPDRVLASVEAAHSSRLALVYMKDAQHTLSIHALRTGEHLYTVELPDLGSVSKLSASREHEFLTYVFTSFLYPGTVFYVDLNMPYADGTRVFRSMTPPGFDASKYRTRQVFFKSKDGTRVPMFIVAPRAATTENPPTLLYGYGGFSISLTPAYSARWASWLHCLRGVVCVANLRGGNEYGVAWHEAGILGRKQNVFDDFQAAARALTDPQIVGPDVVTTPERIACMGGSNGGLLVGACINQAPSLFGAAIGQVGVMDMLRFHKFTIGSAWVSDFGSPDDEEQFHHLFKYSPLHNVFNPDERGTPYPSVLLLTGDHDDRVVPLHTLKLTATLQHTAGRATKQRGRPLLVRVDEKAGHGAGKPTSKVVDEITDTLIFAAIALKAEL